MVRALALALTVLTGFSGLVYEVAWQRYLATLLGSHSEATAAILGLFLGGLSAGYALFGRVARGLVGSTAVELRTPSLLRAYGLVEASIGAWALVFPLLFAGVRALSLALPLAAGSAGFAADALLAALLIGPPTVLMGGTIPLLTQALAHDLSDATRFHAFVYAFNTAGAFFGALAAGFLLVPRLGLPVTLATMSAVNLTAGIAFVTLGRSRARGPALPATTAGATVPRSSGAEDRHAAAPRRAAKSEAGSATGGKRISSGAGLSGPGCRACAFVAFLGGFAMMAVQTVLNRVGAFSFGASQFTFSMVVATFVLCIALGSFAVSALARIPPVAAFAVQAGLAVALAALYLPMQDAPYWVHELRRRFGHDASDFYPYWFASFGWLLAVLAIPIGLSGAMLPLLFHVLRRRVEDLGRVAGRLYSWNTLGSVCGALFGGYAFLAWLDLHQVYRIAVGLQVVAAAVLGAQLLHGRRRLTAMTALGALALGLLLVPRWDPLRLSSGSFRGRSFPGPSGHGPHAFFAGYAGGVSVLFYDDDPTTSVAVLENKQPRATPDRAVVNNGKSDGEIPGDYCTTVLCGILPALLADRVESAFVIGYGTGVTVGELASLGTMRRVEVAEIASGVLRAAPFFEYGNERAASNPKVRTIRSDAYRALVRSRGGYDVIASEPSNPWVTGVEMLYSREFLSTARDRLAPGGVYAQWFHLYETDTATASLVLRTYTEVFDHVAVWYGLAEDLLILGFKGGTGPLDLDRLERRVASPDYARALARANIRGLPSLLAHELLPLDVLRTTPLPPEVHSLYHPRLSDMAARAFFRGEAADLPPTFGAEPAATGVRNSLLRRYEAQFSGGLPDSLRFEVVGETLRYRPRLAATLLAQWEIERPASERLLRLMEAFWNDPILNKGLRPAEYVRLRQLLEGGAHPSFASAGELSDLLRGYYHHAAPFQREALRAALASCPADAAARELGERLGIDVAPIAPERHAATRGGDP